MPGGLMQIVSYGSQDLFLTGTPEITFFKVVYRRHTNFSMESIKFGFDDPVFFGSESSLTAPKVGDLIHKAYLEITLPEIDFKRNNYSEELLPKYQQAQSDYLDVQNFMSINRRAYIGTLDLFAASNTTSIEPIIASINSVFNESGNEPIITKFQELLSESSNIFIYDEISMQEVAGYSPLDLPKSEFKILLDTALNKTVKTQKYFYDQLMSAKKEYEDESNKNLKFAWVDRVGHSIIEHIEVRIGGQCIDRHYGDWINIWYELTANRYLEDSYFKLIGNVPELTNFDRTPKKQYLLRIPLQFWFCRHSGLSIPLVSMEYHDLTFHVKFRNIEDVSYIEDGQTIYISDLMDNIFLDEVPDTLKLNIKSQIAFDYIFLDTQERKRFAQASHEYLIDQTQLLEITDVQQPSILCNLKSLVHPSKELVWVAQKESYTENITGYTKLQWNNYSLSDDGVGNPISSASLDFHSHARVPLLDGNYFNYLQPFECHNSTPSDGINMYSFCINPEEHQPSGTANLSALSRVILNLNMADAENIYNIRIYARNINILRFVSGMGAAVYTH